MEGLASLLFGAQPGTAAAAIAWALLGLLAGSFLSVVIHRKIGRAHV